MAITKIVFDPQTPKNVGEGGTFTFSATFYDGTSLVQPSLIRYRLDDEPSDEQLTGWTTVTAATTVSVTIAATENVMEDEDNRRERRVVTVEASATTTSVVDSIYYDLLNRFGQ